MTHPNHERGGVLLYAVIAVAFLSGLSLYLQKMSDPKLFQTNNTQKILASEYLSDSTKTLLENIIYNNPNLPKTEDEIIDPSTNQVTSDYISNIVEILTQQNNIFLFSKENLLIASAHKKSKIYRTSLSNNIISENPLVVRSTAEITYEIKSTPINMNKKLVINLLIH